jgi:tetratricopeptide (TPR) repeat protein
MDVTSLFNHAIACGQRQQWGDALASYEQILQVAPDHALAWNNRANVLQLFGRWNDAIASYDRAVGIRPDYVDAVYNRATVLHRLRRWNEALAGYEAALAMKADHADALSNRGAVLGELGRRDEALAAFDAALAARPGYAQAHSNKARVLQDLERWDEALENLDRATALDPQLVEAQWNRALLQLLRGDYAQGWRNYEWRWRVDGMRPFLRNLGRPMWLGRESLAGKTILLHAEQGAGDTLQFSRYLPAIAAQATRVILEVAPHLKPLLAANFPAIEVIARGAPLPPFDVHCALGTLPFACGTTLASIPPPPAIRARDEKAREWEARLGSPAALRVGIAWAGNPQHVADHRRSIPFETFAPLLKEPFEFHVLQKELRVDPQSIRSRFPRVHLWMDELRDFEDTAALIAELDLVVTIDSAVAHLAASMGKPVWVLLASVPDFRWLLGRTDSPWYPAVRLFRQPRRDDWESVLADVRRELAQLAGR